MDGGAGAADGKCGIQDCDLMLLFLSDLNYHWQAGVVVTI